MADPCNYCGCDVRSHDPVFVAELVDGKEERTGQFCNYACLARHIDERDLAAGTACNVEL